jgi:hypothetical protein
MIAASIEAKPAIRGTPLRIRLIKSGQDRTHLFYHFVLVASNRDPLHFFQRDFVAGTPPVRIRIALVGGNVQVQVSNHAGPCLPLPRRAPRKEAIKLGCCRQ